jgi:template-activating factor I
LQLFAHLTSFKVVRDKNEPKEVEFAFTFSPNEYLEDDSLELKKSFSNIQAPDSESHVTSTKVPIKWKPGKDLTKVVKGIPQSFFSWFAFEKEGKDDFQSSIEIAIVLADEIYPHAHRIFQESLVEESDEGDQDEDLEGRGVLLVANILRGG